LLDAAGFEDSRLAKVAFDEDPDGALPPTAGFDAALPVGVGFEEHAASPLTAPTASTSIRNDTDRIFIEALPSH
jgi:hypothetical protein